MLINIPSNATNVYTVGGLEPATSYRFSVLKQQLTGIRALFLSLILSTGFDPIITHFGYYGNGLDRYISSYPYDRVHIHCATSNSTHAPADWFFANGTRVGVRDRNFQAGHFTNGTAVLQIANNRSLRFCDGGTYTCIVNTTSGHFETKNFTLVINSKLTGIYMKTTKYLLRLLFSGSPPTPSKPFAIKPRSTSITIGWSESYCDGGHTLRNFTIRYTYYSTYSYQYIRGIDPTLRSYIIIGLRSNMRYSLSPGCWFVFNQFLLFTSLHLYHTSWYAVSYANMINFTGLPVNSH